MAASGFRSFYTQWLGQSGLQHGSAARQRFAAAFPSLCGRDAGRFHLGYSHFLARSGLIDSEAVFVQYCAPRWQVHQLLHDATRYAAPLRARAL